MICEAEGKREKQYSWKSSEKSFDTCDIQLMKFLCHLHPSYFSLFFYLSFASYFFHFFIQLFNQYKLRVCWMYYGS